MLTMSQTSRLQDSNEVLQFFNQRGIQGYRQYYRNLKQPTQTLREHIYIDIENFIDITSMPSRLRNAPPHQRNTSSRASRVLRDSDSDDDVMSYPTPVGSSTSVNHYGGEYSDRRLLIFSLHW